MFDAMDVMREIADVIIQSEAYLNELDRTVGDGDHGSNLAAGYRNCLERLKGREKSAPVEVLRRVGVELLHSMEGCAGPLYAKAYMGAAQALAQRETKEITTEAACAMLAAAIQGVADKGGGDAGCKTMLDAMLPALCALKAAQAEKLPLFAAMRRALQAAWSGVAFTKTIPAKKGTAYYLGEATLGYQDPGATSFALTLSVVCDFCNRAARA